MTRIDWPVTIFWLTVLAICSIVWGFALVSLIDRFVG